MGKFIKYFSYLLFSSVTLCTCTPHFLNTHTRYMLYYSYSLLYFLLFMIKHDQYVNMDLIMKFTCMLKAIGFTV